MCPAGETCIESECYEPGLGPIGGPVAPLAPTTSNATLKGGDLEDDASDDEISLPEYKSSDVGLHGKLNDEL